MNAQTKEQILSRLKSIEGHVRGIQRMVAEDNYCIDVIGQVQAVQKALDRVNSLILDNHLNSCVITAVRSGQPTPGSGRADRLIDPPWANFCTFSRPAVSCRASSIVERNQTMTVKTYSVPNISCHHCVNTIERELKDVAGVTSVKGNVSTKAVMVEVVDADRLAAVEATLVEIGYPVEK